MTIAEVLRAARFVVNSRGERTDVMLPLSAWESLLATWKQLIELLEDEEDTAILQTWLEERKAGKVETISLGNLEQELVADGLLPS